LRDSYPTGFSEDGSLQGKDYPYPSRVDKKGGRGEKGEKKRRGETRRELRDRVGEKGRFFFT